MNLNTFRFQAHTFAQLSKDEHGKIDVVAVKERSKTLPEYKLIDNIKILQTVFARQLPPERFNGLIYLIYASRPSATTKEIQTALVKIEKGFHLNHIFMHLQIYNFRTIFMAPKPQHHQLTFRMQVSLPSKITFCEKLKKVSHEPN